MVEGEVDDDLTDIEADHRLEAVMEDEHVMEKQKLKEPMTSNRRRK